MKPGHLVTYGLAGGCALLLLVAAALMSGFGSRVKPVPPAVVEAEPTLAEPPQIDDRLSELTAYAEINERPLFNEDRLPREGDDDGDDEPGEGEALPGQSVDLAVSIAGIVVTPMAKLAMVKDERTNRTIVMREGMPLEGDQASWTLTSIEPRKLVFDGVTGGNTEVELAVYTGALQGPAAEKPRRRARRSGRNQNANANANAAQTAEESRADRESRAEEIRRKVAERRAQMRAEAARRRAERQAEDEYDDGDGG